MSRYDDILYHERPKKYKEPMQLLDRAAQFAPFAALSGHEEAIEETARRVEEKIIIDEERRVKIAEKLYEILNEHRERNVLITYIKKDEKKDGGVYLSDIGVIKKYDEIKKCIIMDNGIEIQVADIADISVESEDFA